MGQRTIIIHRKDDPVNYFAERMRNAFQATDHLFPNRIIFWDLEKDKATFLVNESIFEQNMIQEGVA